MNKNVHSLVDIYKYSTLLNRNLSFSSHNFKNIQEYMCVILKLNSGDEFRIICKEIIV